jgi:uncharacterized protein
VAACTLIYVASASKNEKVKLLLEGGADTALKTLAGFTALELAANRACLKMLKAEDRQFQMA